MSQEISLLEKLLRFYSSRYTGTTMEAKFNDAIEDLITTGDIKRGTYITFCIDNNVEPRVSKKTKSSSSSSNNISSGCLGSSTYRSSSC